MAEVDWQSRALAAEHALEDAISALDDIATGAWRRYPYHEQHGCATIAAFAAYVGDKARAALAAAERARALPSGETATE
jgi:hypothetical protein